MTKPWNIATERVLAILEDFDWLVANGESEEIAASRCGVNMNTIRHYRGRVRRASEGAA